MIIKTSENAIKYTFLYKINAKQYICTNTEHKLKLLFISNVYFFQAKKTVRKKRFHLIK